MVARRHVVLRQRSRRLVEAVSHRAARSLDAVVRNPPPGAEFGRPQWVFGTATWVFADADRIVAAYTRAGRWHLATVHVHTGLLTDVPTGLVPAGLDGRDRAARGPGRRPRPSGPTPWCASTSTRFYVEELRLSSDVQVDAAYISTPEPIEFPTEDGRTAHAFYYAPRNKNFVAPRGRAAAAHRRSATAARRRRRGPRSISRSSSGPAAGLPWRTSTTAAAPGTAATTASGSTASGASSTSRTSSTSTRYLVTQGKADVRRLARSRRKRRRLHDAGGADVLPGRVQRRRELLRHQRRGSAGARHAQVRSALPRHADRSVSRR